MSQLLTGDLVIDATGDNKTWHVVIFEKWANSAHSSYWAFEQRGSYGRAPTTSTARCGHAGRQQLAVQPLVDEDRLDRTYAGKNGRGAYVSAYYLARWGNDEAKDVNGAVIPNCRRDGSDGPDPRGTGVRPAVLPGLLPTTAARPKVISL